MNKENKDKVSNGYMSKWDVRKFIGGEFHPLPSSTLYDWITKNGFPKPFYPTPRQPIWRKSEVMEWMEERAKRITQKTTSGAHHG